MNMLGIVRDRFPLLVRKLLRPLAFNIDNDNYENDIKHNWGDMFFFENFTLIRVYAFPQPPHILPKFVPERLTIVEFLW